MADPAAPTVDLTPPRPPATPRTDPARAPQPEDTQADRDERRALRRGMTRSLWLWFGLFGLDLFMALVAYPSAPIALFVGARILGGLLIALVIRSAASERVTMTALRRTYVLVMFAIGALISFMGLPLGGLDSPYLHGVSVLILVVATLTPGTSGVMVRRTLPCALSFPLVMIAASFARDDVAAALRSQKSLVRFAANYAFVLASVFIGAFVGDAVASARRQVREARRLGRYRLEAQLGRGGMGDVWLAWDPQLQRQVALKILRDEGDGEDPARLSRFEREARAASRLTTPHAVRILDFGVSDDGVAWIAMEYLRGSDLDALVKAVGPLPPERVVRYGVQACRCLAEAHAVGVIHRDIKPANLFVAEVGDEHDVLKVLDFGVARLVDAHGAKATRTGAVIGTPAYMAPELVLGSAPSPATDLYSLGATLYHLLTGAPPFADEGSGAVLAAHVSTPPVPPSARLGRPVPAEFEAIILRCLAKDPAKRPASATELRRLLERSLDDAASS